MIRGGDSMFFVKLQSENLTAKIQIEPDNVYTRCAGCGDEMQVNLETILQNGDADLLSTAVFCERCSRTICRNTQR